MAEPADRKLKEHGKPAADVSARLQILRLCVTAMVALLSLAAVWFYWRQNASGAAGGGISVAKVMWLAYALGAWFMTPAILAADTRLHRSLRTLFGVFWLWMMARGVAELFCMYVAAHWHPAYGVTHDVLTMAMLVVLQIYLLRKHRGSFTLRDRVAAGFVSTLLVGLLAETAFALMFVQSPAYKDGLFFVSAAAGWLVVNAATWVTVVVLYADGLWLLMQLYLVADPVTRLWRQWLRAAAMLTAMVVVAGVLGVWSWMMEIERAATAYQTTGIGIIRSCDELKKNFVAGNRRGVADFGSSAKLHWSTTPDDHGHDFTVLNWRGDDQPGTLAEGLNAWRGGLAEVKQAAFKLHLIDEVISPREVVARIRFEVVSPGATSAGMFRMQLYRDDDDRWRPQQAALLEGVTIQRAAPLFTDEAKSRGVDFVIAEDPRYTPANDSGGLRFQTMRYAYAGVTTFDYNGDGHDDLLFCSGAAPALYRNAGDGTFTQVTAEAGLTGLQHINTAIAGDLDNDGDQDLYMAAFYGPDYLLKNDGSGRFSQVKDNGGLGNVETTATTALLDYDNDGDLDLYLGRLLDAKTAIPDSFLYTRNGQPNLLFRNDGGLQFTDVTAESGAGDVGMTLGIAAADYDRDGDQDIYLANDFGRNVLLQNQGDGSFRDIAAGAGVLAVGGSMSASWGDYDNDGRLDLYVAAIRSNQRWFVQPQTVQRVLWKFAREGRLLTTSPLVTDLKQHMGDQWQNIGNHALAGNSLLKQTPDGKFKNMAEEAGARPAGWYWSSGFLDFDNDGDLDIYATDGWITGENNHDL